MDAPIALATAPIVKAGTTSKPRTSEANLKPGSVTSANKVVLTDVNDPKKKPMMILKERFLPPIWKDYKVFDDATILSWLKLSALSNIRNKDKLEKSKRFEDIWNISDLCRLLETLVQPDDKIIIGFGEELVFHKHFDLDIFSLTF